jgi:hypothetical protein
MINIAQKIKELNLMKAAMKALKRCQIMSLEYKEMIAKAENKNRQKVLRDGLDLIKAHFEISKRLRTQRDFVVNVYQKRLKQKLIRFLRLTSKDFRRLEIKIMSYMISRLEYNVLHAFRNHS